MTRSFALLIAAVLTLVACGAPTGSPGPTASPTPSPSGGGAGSTAELRYALIARFGLPWFCDPDEYPIGRDEATSARERFPEIRADAATLAAILVHLGLPAVDALTDAQRLAAYREWKVLNAVVLDPVGNGRYRFDYLARPKGAADEGTRSGGLIGPDGAIEVEQEAAAGEPICPICLDGATRIDTPSGAVRIDELRAGAPVWTFDAGGQRVAGVVLAVRWVEAPATHRLVHLVLDDGRELLASPGHPVLDGRPLGDLRRGDQVDGATVVSADLVASGPRTWDLLASGPTGGYLAGGIRLQSTLAP